MVACFRYASIDVHSVYLPPSKLEFHYDDLDWLQKEANGVQGLQIISFCDTAAVTKLLDAYWLIDHVYRYIAKQNYFSQKCRMLFIRFHKRYQLQGHRMLA